MQAIKSIARGPWGITTKNRDTWYQPFEAQADIDKAIHWVMGRGDVFINTVGDMDLLPRVLDAASRYGQRPDDARDARADGRTRRDSHLWNRHVGEHRGSRRA